MIRLGFWDGSAVHWENLPPFDGDFIVSLAEDANDDVVDRM